MNKNKDRPNSLGKSVLKRKIAKVKKLLAQEETVTDELLDQILSMAMSLKIETPDFYDIKLIHEIVNWKKVCIEKQKLLVGTKDIDDSISDYPQD